MIEARFASEGEKPRILRFWPNTELRKPYNPRRRLQTLNREYLHMGRLTVSTRSVFFWSAYFVVSSVAALAAETPEADLGLPAPRAGESVGLASMTLNGKPFSFNQVVAYQTLQYGKPALAVFFSDAPIAVDELKATLLKNGGDDGDFGEFQTRFKLLCSADGLPQNCSFYKDGLSVSLSGADWKGQFVIKAGRVRGKATLVSGDDPARRKSFDIRLDAQLITAPLPNQTASTTSTTPAADPSAPPAKKPVAGLAVKSLPMPADATEVEYKEIVGQISYKSRADVASLAALLARDLAAQGWTSEDDSDLVTPASAILSRKRGEAELTIFVKPAAGGSSVQIMSEGLQW
jgi:hypothetical protein